MGPRHATLLPCACLSPRAPDASRLLAPARGEKGLPLKRCRCLLAEDSAAPHRLGLLTPLAFPYPPGPHPRRGVRPGGRRHHHPAAVPRRALRARRGRDLDRPAPQGAQVPLHLRRVRRRPAALQCVHGDVPRGRPGRLGRDLPRCVPPYSPPPGPPPTHPLLSAPVPA